MENSTEVPQKIKNRTTVRSSIYLLGIYAKEIKSVSQRDYALQCSLPHYYDNQDMETT